MFDIKTKIWLEKDGELIFGAGKTSILKAVDETGSINKAAKKLGMSYRHAWSYIRSIENRLGITLVIKSKGGQNGGGAALTEQARDLVERFETLDKKIKDFSNKCYSRIFTGSRYGSDR